MLTTKTKIDDVFIIEPKLYKDARGYFYESYNQKNFDSVLGNSLTFVQDNCSLSKKGVLRGLHYQLPPFAQAKLVSCVLGEIYDVAVDIRIKSATYGQWVGAILNEENMKQMWIPEGFAHGFIVLSETAKVVYKTNCHYMASHESTIKWDDPDLNIYWPFEGRLLLSEKDRKGVSFRDAVKF
ncbi:dTDP-4-dehydrorhamnose 3,5-epimerase [Atlantibacter subterraneus]|uniref:dTDP-4-dehydrorhamnose 3,5-epimerase n=1 Tax=Atlantibacter subterraneus TaxID=255519 RepID=UPI002899DCD7|nr:dTDP-4-dehydrorhamnose 3,5-epimerase [Atlantibacter subterranea]